MSTCVSAFWSGSRTRTAIATPNRSPRQFGDVGIRSCGLNPRLPIPPSIVLKLGVPERNRTSTPVIRDSVLNAARLPLRHGHKLGG